MMETYSSYYVRKDFYRFSSWLIYLSLLILILDGIVGIDVFLADEHSGGHFIHSGFYRAAFFVKVILLILCVFLHSKIPKGFLLPVLCLFLGSKFLLGIYYGGPLKSILGHSYFYCFLILGLIGGWQLTRCNLDKIIISTVFVKLLIWVTTFICVLYFSLYQLGFIYYFGMGLQSYIILGVFLSTQSSLFYLCLIVVSVFLTGKRSSFLITIMQIFGPKMLSGKLSLVKILTGTLSFLIVLYGGYQVGLLARFQGMVDLFTGLDTNDLIQSRDLFFLATGGRTEEFFAYFVDQDLSVMSMIFGRVAGYTFPITDWRGYVFQHYYFHVSPLNYIMHFGIPLGVLLILYQLKLFVWALRYVTKHKNLYCFLYIAFYLASWFSAIIIVDILCWVVFFYCHFFRKEIKKMRYVLAINAEKKSLKYQ